MALNGFMQTFKGAIFASSRSLIQFGKGLGSPISLSGNISAQLNGGGVGNGADTTEDTLFTFAMPANSLNSNGRGVFIEVFGSLANNAHTKTLRVYFGTSVVWTPINGTQANISFMGGLCVYRNASGSQVALGTGQMGASSLLLPTTVIAGADADTAAITIKATGQTATATANDIICNGMVVTAFN